MIHLTNITEGSGVLIVCSCGRRVRPASAPTGKCPSCGKKLPGVNASAPSDPPQSHNRRVLGLLLVLLATSAFFSA